MPTQRTKRHQRSSATETDEAPTTNLYVESVIESTDCWNIHGVRAGHPCYAVEGLTGSFIYAICDNRARRAGYVGHASAQALQSRRYN